jgi:hypothetical protein
VVVERGLTLATWGEIGPLGGISWRSKRSVSLIVKGYPFVTSGVILHRGPISAHVASVNPRSTRSGKSISVVLSKGALVNKDTLKTTCEHQKSFDSIRDNCLLINLLLDCQFYSLLYNRYALTLTYYRQNLLLWKSQKI